MTNLSPMVRKYLDWAISRQGFVFHSDLTYDEKLDCFYIADAGDDQYIADYHNDRYEAYKGGYWTREDENE